MTTQLPRIGLEGPRDGLAGLVSDIDGYFVDRVHDRAFQAWLRLRDGRTLHLINGYTLLAPMFEVFPVCLAWQDENPRMPERLDPWPFPSWRTQVLTRVEFIIEDVEIEGAFGQNPNFQAATRPGDAPPEASAACEIAAGLLFSSADGARLLFACVPISELLVTDDAAVIDEYLEHAEPMDLWAYLERGLSQ